MEQINHANGEASAMLAVAEARAQGLNIVSQSLKLQVIFKSNFIPFHNLIEQFRLPPIGGQKRRFAIYR